MARRPLLDLIVLIGLAIVSSAACSGEQLTAEEYSDLVCGTATTESLTERLAMEIADDGDEGPRFRHMVLALDWLIEFIEGVDPPDGFEDYHEYSLRIHRSLKEELLEYDQDLYVDPEEFQAIVVAHLGDWEVELSEFDPPIRLEMTEQGCRLSIAES